MSRGTQTINLALHYTIVQFVIEIYRRSLAKSVDYSERKLFKIQNGAGMRSGNASNKADVLQGYPAALVEESHSCCMAWMELLRGLSGADAWWQ